MDDDDATSIEEFNIDGELNISESDDDIDNDDVTISIITDIEDNNKFYEMYNISNYKTFPVLTKFEKTQILSERMMHLSNGCNSYINTDNYDNLYDIALEELNSNLLPYILKRSIGKNIEYWKLEDLKKI